MVLKIRNVILEGIPKTLAVVIVYQLIAIETPVINPTTLTASNEVMP